MKKVICPICNKDLTKSLKLLNFDFQVHIDMHITNCNIDILVYMNQNIDDIPTELAELLKKRTTYIAKLNEYNKTLKE